MLKSINWVSFLMGVVFALFVWPMIGGLLRKPSVATTAR